ncbi:hypothetical protein ARMGADRAFT_456932 [Armillaria gallica]|uniref:Uncharacterized protein n=1 Tax=Armillaria gallica TaxID=47427 RepID=A0A2H3CWU2_ARMGA|nr:hypothetical protein ARMGADRAFT_456932 [Armillaria gallica]
MAFRAHGSKSRTMPLGVSRMWLPESTRQNSASLFSHLHFYATRTSLSRYFPYAMLPVRLDYQNAGNTLTRRGIEGIRPLCTVLCGTLTWRQRERRHRSDICRDILGGKRLATTTMGDGERYNSSLAVVLRRERGCECHMPGLDIPWLYSCTCMLSLSRMSHILL